MLVSWEWILVCVKNAMWGLGTRLYGHRGIPLLSSSKVHSLDIDWLLAQWMGTLLCVYTGLLKMLQARVRLPPILFFFCQLDASWGCWTGKSCSCLFCTLELLLYILPTIRPVVWGLYPSFRPGLLCGNRLDRAWGILDDRKPSDVYEVCLGVQLLCVCHFREM